jgi:hypothetical protein
MVPIVATGFVAFGTMSVMAASPRLPPPGQSQAGRETAATPTLPTVVDAYTRYAASAIAATTTLRSVLGALLPLAG